MPTFEEAKNKLKSSIEAELIKTPSLTLKELKKAIDDVKNNPFNYTVTTGGEQTDDFIGGRTVSPTQETEEKVTFNDISFNDLLSIAKKNLKAKNPIMAILPDFIANGFHIVTPKELKDYFLLNKISGFITDKILDEYKEIYNKYNQLSFTDEKSQILSNIMIMVSKNLLDYYNPNNKDKNPEPINKAIEQIVRKINPSQNKGHKNASTPILSQHRDFLPKVANFFLRLLGRPEIQTDSIKKVTALKDALQELKNSSNSKKTEEDQNQIPRAPQ